MNIEKFKDQLIAFDFDKGKVSATDMANDGYKIKR